ncbi:MAG: DUF4271 domain-containing protein [Chitinophagaceae bacterium]
MYIKQFILLAFFLGCSCYCSLQAQDSTITKPVNDSVTPSLLSQDTALQITGPDSARILITDIERFPAVDTSLIYGKKVGKYILEHPYYKAMSGAVRVPSLVRIRPDTDWIFYLFVFCLIFLALIRLAFPKYFLDLFRVFFNSSLRQKQIREQLIQEPLPSLMLNIFFVFSAGGFLYFVARHYGFTKPYNQWLAFSFSILLLVAVYLVKFIFLRFIGWIFGKQAEAETYTFIVFMINKMAGLVFLPVSILLAFSNYRDAQPVINLGLFLLIILLAYRFVKTFGAIHKSLKINQLHFILLIFALDVLPIMLLYKVLIKLF